MSSLTDAYLNGAKAFNAFFGMLHLAILESMPGVVVSGDGASVWRGYRIDAYRDLAPALFCCQIYADNPNTLIFQEGYRTSKYKALDPRDKKYKIKDGGYYYPFRIKLDLYQSRFFLFTATEQYELLRNFVSYASSQALIWQRSALRARPDLTGKEFLHGSNNVTANPVVRPSGYEQVHVDYLNVISFQEELFAELKSVALAACAGNYEWFRPNSNWRNWEFRGYRLKLSPGGSADFVWEITYSEPEKLVYCSYDNNARKPEGYFDVRSTAYFDQTPEKRELLLREFVKNTLGSRLPLA